MADDATVLPQGIWRVGAAARFSLSMTKRSPSSGGVEDRAAEVNHDLTSTVFRDVRLVEVALRPPAGSGTCGTGVVDVAWHMLIPTFQAASGRTDRRSIEVCFPS